MNGFVIRRRATGAALALLLQALFIAALLQALRPVAIPEKLARELTLILPRLEKAQAPPREARRSSSTPTIPLPFIPRGAPPSAIMPFPLTPTPEQLQGLGRDLFGCTPENWSGLTPSERAHCPRPGEGVAIQSGPDLLHTRDHVQDEAHWASEWADERAPPPAIPCSHTGNADLGHGVLVPMLTIDLTTCGHTPPGDVFDKWKPLN